MFVCRAHLDRETAMTTGTVATIPMVPRRQCEVQACGRMAEFDWVPDVNQDEIPTIREEKP